MSSETIIAVVTIICGCIVTVVTLLTRSEVVQLKATVAEQTLELAKMHQTVIAQSARIYDAEATRTGVVEKMGRKPHEMPTEQPYTANPPYKPPDARK